jgi:hypothetical protein
MSDFGTDKNTQFAEDKAKNKFDELSGSALLLLIVKG